MLDQFKHYFRPPRKTLELLWHNGIIACDASVLLNIYGYSDETREDLLRVLEVVGSRVKIPFQFGLEYSRNRPKVILKQVANYHRVEKILHDLKNVNFAPRREHPFLSVESAESFEKILAEMEAGRGRVNALLKDDPYAERIVELFNGKVGSAPTDEVLKKMHADAKLRYASHIPPGFADLKEKGEPDAYGDYIGWCQLMEIAKSEKKDVLLITDDTKEDWWHYEKELLLGPRPELVGEFHQVTSQNFYMYSSESFLIHAVEYLDQKVTAGTLKEVAERLADQREQVGRKPVTSSAINDLSTLEAEKPLNLKPSGEERPLKPKTLPEMDDQSENLK